MPIKISNILNLLVLQFNKEDYDSEAFDSQLEHLISNIETMFANNEIETVLEWLHESIKKERDLRNRMISSPDIYRKESNAILMSKINMLHSKIIELLIDRIDQSAFSKDNDLTMKSIQISQQFVTSLTINRFVDEQIYDRYVSLIQEAMKIFST